MAVDEDSKRDLTPNAVHSFDEEAGQALITTCTRMFHPRVPGTTSLGSQGKYQEADSLNLKAIGIWEKYLGPNHPSLAAYLVSRGRLLQAQVIFFLSDARSVLMQDLAQYLSIFFFLRVCHVLLSLFECFVAVDLFAFDRRLVFEILCLPRVP